MKPGTVLTTGLRFKKSFTKDNSCLKCIMHFQIPCLFLLALKQPWARSGSQVSVGLAEEGLVSEEGSSWGQLLVERRSDFLLPGSLAPWLPNHTAADFWSTGLEWKMSPATAPSGAFSFKFYTENTGRRSIYTKGIAMGRLLAVHYLTMVKSTSLYWLHYVRIFLDRRHAWRWCSAQVWGMKRRLASTFPTADPHAVN